MERILFPVFLHYKAVSLRVIALSLRALLNSRACAGAGYVIAQCTFVNQSINHISKQLIASLILQAACAVVGVRGLETDCVEMPGVPLGT